MAPKDYLGSDQRKVADDKAKKEDDIKVLDAGDIHLLKTYSDTIEEDRDGDGDTFWNDDTLTDAGKPNNYATNAGADDYAKERGFDTFWAYCCNERSRNCGATSKH